MTQGESAVARDDRRRFERVVFNPPLRATANGMPASLIDSQFAALEPPTADENAIKLDAAKDPAELVALVVSALALSGADAS